MENKVDEQLVKEKKLALPHRSSAKIFKKKHKGSRTLGTEKQEESRKRPRKSQYDPEVEAKLERIVFGDPSDIINNLPKDEVDLAAEKAEKILKVDAAAGDSEADEDAGEESGTRDKVKKAAWVDDDDAEYLVKDAFTAQNRASHMREDVPEKLYSELLQNKYKQLVGTPKWAELQRKDPEDDDLDNDILKHSCHVEKPKLKALAKNIIELKALTPINKETRTEGPIVSSVEFHPSSTVALVAGSSGILSIFQVDGIQNPKLHSMQYNKFPINNAKFLREGMEILCGSQYYSHCHSYDLIGGKTIRVPLPHGITNMGTFEVSPNGKFIAICGRMGEIYLLASTTKELIGTFKMNARCRALVFTPDSTKLITHGESNEIYIWDVNNRTCVHRAIDDGCIKGSSIAIAPSGQFLATGSKEGVVNLYDMKNVLNDRCPVPLKSVLNLVTSITALKFNPLSEILAIASNKKPNAFKMLHLPSFTIFSNFPTFQTNMFMPQAINFSPGSGFLSVSNRSGTAFLYRLKHYQNY